MNNLHNDIMNLAIGGDNKSVPLEALDKDGKVSVIFKLGHRNARHDAAELAIAYDAAIEEMTLALELAKQSITQLLKADSEQGSLTNALLAQAVINKALKRVKA